MSYWFEKIKRPILALAPMHQVSRSELRQECRKFGADATFSEMIAAEAIVRPKMLKSRPFSAELKSAMPPPRSAAEDASRSKKRNQTCAMRIAPHAGNKSSRHWGKYHIGKGAQFISRFLVGNTCYNTACTYYLITVLIISKQPGKTYIYIYMHAMSPLYSY